MKNIIKSLAVAAVISLSASVLADSSYLYWMTENLSDFGSGWNYAKVAYNDGNGGTGYLGLGTIDDPSEFGNNLLNPLDEFTMMRVAIGSVELANSYTFALELFNDDKSVGISQWLAYDTGFIGGGSFDPSKTEATFGGFHIPEPTSGLLMMMGFGLLALRRKQKKA